MKNFIFIAALAAFLGGCIPASNATRQNMHQSEPSWSKYIKNDGSVGEVAFYSENLAKTYALKDGDVIGMALAKIDGKAVKLGDMYALGGFSFIVQELDNGLKFGYRYVNMHDKAEHEKLKTAKKIKFYQFGGGILQTTIFSASGGAVCEQFAAKKPVNARSVTNYYDKDDATNSQFFATIMDVRVVKDEPSKIKNLDFKFMINDASLEAASTQARSNEFKSKVIDKDAQKQERLLKNIICALPAK